MEKTSKQEKQDLLKVGLAQISPVWLNRNKTISKVVDYVHQSGKKGCQLVVFGEAIVPGYPFWLERTDGARFDDKLQKEIFAHYLDQAVQISAGDLDPICTAARENNQAVYLGIVERPADRGGHSLYCSLVYINQRGEIQSVHRKLRPTYEERLVWAAGDGHGLQVHPLGKFNLGGLNCWENWMPLSRSALYGLGEDLHIAVWPGSHRNTQHITTFIAQESRSYVISVSGLLHKKHIPTDIPHGAEIIKKSEGFLADGGSCLSGPAGDWIVEPVVGDEKLIIAQINHQRVREERQNFDPAGHYSRPDVTSLMVNRTRQNMLDLVTDLEKDPKDENQAI